MQWNKGDILKSKHEDAVHPIIFLEGYDDSYFIGAMISTKGPERHLDSIPMEKEHFEEIDENGEVYEIYFGPSFLVDALLLKEHRWKPFDKTGRLTPVGVEFVQDRIMGKYPMLWKEYKRYRQT